MIYSCKFIGIVSGKDDVSHANMAVPPFLASKLCLFGYFSKNYCTLYKSITITDIFM